MKWTQDEDATILAAAARGMTYSDMTALLPGRSHAVIQRRGARLGVVRQVYHSSEHIENVLALWNGTGLNAREIAAQLGVTKNAIIGVVNRNKSRVTREVSDYHRRGAQTRKAKTLMAQAPALPPLSDRPCGVPFAVAQLERGECHYPYGDPDQRDFHFCGRPTTRGSWCGEHRRIVFRLVEVSHAKAA